jgi:hypothetical protein
VQTGSGRLRDYRVYYLDANGRVFRRESIRCANDELALARLDRPRANAAVELWELGRLVKRLESAS